MHTLRAAIEQTTDAICEAEALQWRIDWFEYFPATTNTATGRHLVAKAANELGLKVEEKPHGFRFGEDFGWLSKHYPAAMFGLGAGLDCPALHHDTYDFPDELIETGKALFAKIIEGVLGPETA